MDVDFAEFARSIQKDLFGDKEKAAEAARVLAEREARSEAARRANLLQGAEMRIAEAGIPRRVLDKVRELQESSLADLGGELPSPIPECMRLVADGPTDIVVALGPVGEGKSVAAGYALIAALEQGKTGLWRTGVQIATELASWDKEDAGVRRRAALVDILAVDDLGLEPDREQKAARRIADLLKLRYESRLKTVVTSNIADAPTFLARYGSALADRLRTRHGLLTLCGGNAYRKNQR